MSDFMMSGLIVGVLAILFFTPACMALGIEKYDGDVPMANRLICCIPIVNLVRAEIKYYGKIRFVTISTITLFLGIVARVYIWRNYYDNVTLGTASIVIFYAVIFFWLLGNMIFVYNVIHDADALSGWKLILYTIAFPFGQYYVGAYLNNVVRHMRTQEETFKQ